MRLGRVKGVPKYARMQYPYDLTDGGKVADVKWDGKHWEVLWDEGEEGWGVYLNGRLEQIEFSLQDAFTFILSCE
jgi:hypothetical protein